MDVSSTTAALVLLLAVLGVAAFGRVWMAMAAAFAATLALNFFFLPPLGTFTISDPDNWIALLVFLVVAIVGSQLSAAAQRRAREVARGALASTLLTSLSHDLRTPLTAIRVAIGNLADTPPAAERREQAQIALAELDRLNHLFDHILDMARIDSRAVTAEPQWVTPADVIDAAVAYTGRALDAHALSIDAPSDTAMHVDPRLTSSAVAQLLENAARYSPRGSTITIRVTVGDGDVRVTVEDAGAGIPSAEMPRLFEPFFRGRAGQAVPGTGMGLAIARGLLAAERGRIWAENTGAGGARFCIVVPAESRPAAVA
jgi:two-component system, OmpR family, sensor histidine kinase KdpD